MQPLGQQTGSDPYEQRHEAQRILTMIANISVEGIKESCGIKAADFVTEVRVWLAMGMQEEITGRQLFFLRDVKDKLLDKGLI